MKNMLRRLQMLERLPKLQPPPSANEKIKSLALQCLSVEDLELLRDEVLTERMETGQGELSDQGAAALLAAKSALETEAKRAGFTSFAEAERSAGHRR